MPALPTHLVLCVLCRACWRACFGRTTVGTHLHVLCCKLPPPSLGASLLSLRLLFMLGASVCVRQDTMESFFLSETVKYLYLLFSNASAVVDHFVLSTEVRFCCYAVEACVAWLALC